ncbi:MAG TPA: substrate-binding domain-containing protein [Paraburkholderia sp.]|nr:substrate-binding domain-containing protein [Paraburkholderia sp.]
MATLKEVAARAGVGLGTASRAISGKGPVSAAALARVREAVEALDFRPSSIGRAMVQQSLGIIGIFAPTFIGSYYGSLLREADTELRAVGRHIVVATGCGAVSPREQALEGVEFLIERDCDGILVVSHDLLDEDLLRLRRSQPRMAFLNRVFERMPEASFCADHWHGGELAARTLLEHGHRQFAVIAGPFTAADNMARIDGFRVELARHGIGPEQMTVVESDFSTEGGYASMRRLLDAQARFTGLFCANDQMAAGALSCLHQAGVEVPRQMSVIGYDDDFSAPYLTPALTSVHVPTVELTRNATRWLINACYGNSLPIERDFPVSVTMRASVGQVG